MLKIKNVTSRNFMSVGAITQVVKFDDNQLTLVLGNNVDLGENGARNGVGKSTIANALSYGLYGEAITYIKRDNLINLTNKKQMMVTVEFEKDGIDYRIERGRRPNVLKLFINGTELEDDDSQGDSRETQKEIEEIIGFSHNMFKNIVALNTYTVPFLSMRVGEQREIIEQLLGVTELSEKADALKELIKSTKERIKEEEITITTIQKSNERIQENISDIERKCRLWDKSHQEKIAALTEGLAQLEKLNVDVELESHKNNSDVASRKDALDTIEAELGRVETSLKRSSKKLSELESNLKHALDGVCHACSQSTAHLPEHEEYTDDIKSKIAEEEIYNKELSDRQEELLAAIASIGDAGNTSKTFYDNVEDALQHKHNMETFASQLAERQGESNPYTEQIDTLKDTGLQEIDFETINELTVLKDHQEFLHKLLTNKDSFIRKKIIDQNISYLNHRLDHYLDKIGLPHEVKFNNDMSVEITEFGRELDFANLSRGEMTRVVIALSLSFRDIYESLNAPMNLLFIDELIDNGLDTIGTESVIGILKKIVRENSKSIFLISHKEELIGRVNNVLTVTKESGFTSWNHDESDDVSVGDEGAV